MKKIGVFSIFTLAASCVLLLAAPAGRVFAGGSSGNLQAVNPPPFDFADFFYQENGINLSVLDSSESARFGLFRQTGPPAPVGEFNWIIDNSNTNIT